MGILIGSFIAIISPDSNNVFALIISSTILLILLGLCLFFAVKLLKGFTSFVNSEFPTAIHENGHRCAGFKKRIIASLIDLFILLPFVFLPFLFTYSSKSMYIVVRIIVPLISYSYIIGLEGYRGQTIGKILTKIRIMANNGTKAGYIRAIKRSSVNIALYIVSFIFACFALVKIPSSDFSGLTFSEAGLLIQQHVELKSDIWLQMLNLLWMLSEFFVLNFNKRKRALHDFIAGTVVLEVDRYNKK